MKNIECVRCGICCFLGTCEYGIESTNGSCKYIIKENKITSCKIMIEQNLIPSQMKMGGGCVLQNVPEVYEHYKKMFNIS